MLYATRKMVPVLGKTPNLLVGNNQASKCSGMTTTQSRSSDKRSQIATNRLLFGPYRSHATTTHLLLLHAVRSNAEAEAAPSGATT